MKKTLQIGDILRVTVKDIVGEFAARCTAVEKNGEPTLELLAAEQMGREARLKTAEYEIVDSETERNGGD